MNRKIAATAGSVMLAGLALAGCHSGTSAGQSAENKAQQADQTTLENNQPIPHYNYSQERQALIDAENAAAAGTQTTSFFFMMGDQDPINSCPSIGMGVPDSASLSNPDQVTYRPNSGSSDPGTPVGQMDPDGIYAPASSTGTWVNCVDSQGRETIVRWEGDVYTVTGAATWDTATHAIKMTGAPTVHINTRTGK